MERTSIQARLEAAYPGLSPQLRLAARYLLDAPDDVALSPLRGVAARAGVHPSSLVRLAKHLEFAGYAELRENFRQRLRAGALTARARELHLRREAGPADLLFEDLQRAAANNIETSFADASADAMDAIADALCQARRIHVVGLRKCFPIAYYLHYTFRMFREEVTLLTGFAGTMADELRDLDAEDALIAISYDPYTKETVQAVDYAREAGATVLAVTDSTVAPLAIAADHALIIANEGPSFFRSLTAAMAMAEAIVAFVLARGREDNLATLRATEAQLARFGVYWSQHPARRGLA